MSQANPVLIRVVQIYARRFLAWINDLPLNELSDVFQKELVEAKIRSFVPENVFMRSSSNELH